MSKKEERDKECTNVEFLAGKDNIQTQCLESCTQPRDRLTGSIRLYSGSLCHQSLVRTSQILREKFANRFKVRATLRYDTSRKMCSCLRICSQVQMRR